MIEYFKLLRVHHWVKNLLVFTGVFFSANFFSEQSMYVLLLFFIFCLASSIIYVSNDIKDRSLDLLHPVKKKRPIPSGKVSLQKAKFLLFSLVVSLTILCFFIDFYSIIILFSYLIINFLYITFLKNIPVVDVFLISFGYILRVLIGIIPLGLELSLWLLVTVLTLSLFLGFSKRYEEMNFSNHKKVLQHYKKDFLNSLMKANLTLSLVFYTIYVILEKNSLISFFGLVFVYFGIFRYLLVFDNSENNFDPIKTFLEDKWLISVFLLWGVFQFVELYII